MDLTFRALREANASRVKKWHSLESWSPLEWAGAMSGEAGEAANVAKKLKRLDDHIQNKDTRLLGNEDASAEMYAEQIAKEVADTLIYGDLLCQRVGMSLEDAVRKVFNKKSEEYGFPERL